jgi:DNA-binding response OmpR family regulator
VRRPNKRILVVDDDPDILASLEFVLNDEGYDVETSTKNGDVVDAAVHSNRPDLIILDILLSGHDGRLICKKLKSQRETRDIPVLLISAHPDAQEMSVEAAADGFLAKPFDIDTLLGRVESLL